MLDRVVLRSRGAADEGSRAAAAAQARAAAPAPASGPSPPPALRAGDDARSGP